MCMTRLLVFPLRQVCPTYVLGSSSDIFGRNVGQKVLVTQHVYYVPEDLQPAAYDNDYLCAMLGYGRNICSILIIVAQWDCFRCLFSWIPIVGLMTYCFNVDAPVGHASENCRCVHAKNFRETDWQSSSSLRCHSSCHRSGDGHLPPDHVASRVRKVVRALPTSCVEFQHACRVRSRMM